MVSITFILGIMRGVGEMGVSRWGTYSFPIDLKFLPVITINLRNSKTEWADLNPQSAFLQTGLIYMYIFKIQVNTLSKFKHHFCMYEGFLLLACNHKAKLNMTNIGQQRLVYLII